MKRRISNSLSKRDGSIVTSLAYDALNQLVQVAKTGQTTQTYAYDDQGRRIRKSVGGSATQYLYNGSEIHGEYTTWSQANALYTHGPNTDDPLIRVAANDTRYYHHDGLGSVVATTDTTGTLNAAQLYDAWGNPYQNAKLNSIPQYGYTGREPDETGMVYYRARYYDPSIGRFTQRDPIGLRGGMNQYAYVGGNPVNLMDPSGNVPTTLQGWIDFSSAAVGLISNGLGVVAAGTGTVTLGAVAIFDPEPITKVGAGVGTIYLAGMTAKSGYGVMANGQNLVDSWNGNTPSMAPSVASYAANIIAPGNSGVALTFDGLDIMTDMSVGKLPITSIPVSKAFGVGGELAADTKLANYEDYANFTTPLWDQKDYTPTISNWFTGLSALDTGFNDRSAIASVTGIGGAGTQSLTGFNPPPPPKH